MPAEEHPVIIRRLQESDAEAFISLRREALQDSPLSFVASPADDFVGSAESLLERLSGAPEWVLFGAFDDTLVGCAGVFRDRHTKASHKAHLWGMYVRESHRGRGVARALLRAVIDHSSSLPGVSAIHLSVTSAAADAKRLYESAGFRTWGTEADALRLDERSVDEDHMVLDLDRKLPSR